MSNVGILLTNTGTPEAPTPQAVRRYLREFLSDKRIVRIPKIIWYPVLYGLVLPLRPRKSATLYQQIWTPNGSPMRTIMHRLAKRLQKKLCEDLSFPTDIEIGMNYGQPSIAQGLETLRKKNVSKIIVLPLYPQYSTSTTASSLDRVTETFKKWPIVPEVHYMRDYANHEGYIQALTGSLSSTWAEQGPSDHLLISFHGIPERFVKAGDPYPSQCEQTAHSLTEKLGLPQEKWTLCYQSSFGYDKWLKPSTQSLLTALPKRGIKKVDVICPGFSVDCLETLEEIAIRGKKTFLQAGGESLRYVPALNDTEAHMDTLAGIIATMLT